MEERGKGQEAKIVGSSRSSLFSVRETTLDKRHHKDPQLILTKISLLSRQGATLVVKSVHIQSLDLDDTMCMGL